MRTVHVAGEVKESDLYWGIGLLPVATLLYDGHEILAMNEKCRELLGMGAVALNCSMHETSADLSLRELPLDHLWARAVSKGESFIEGRMFSESAQERWLECWCRGILVEGRVVALIQLLDITAKKAAERKMIRLSRLRELMLEVTQTVLEVCLLYTSDAADE